MDTQGALDIVGEEAMPVRTDTIDTRLDRLALVISYVFNPLLLFSGCFFLYYAVDRSILSLLYGLLHLGSLFVLFAGYFLVLRLVNKPLDFELRKRSDRIWPLGITFTALIILGVAFWSVTESGPHMYTNVASAAMILAFWLITRYWKVSLHSFSTSFALTALFQIVGLDWVYWPLILLGPVVIWARMHLKHHNLSQSLVGALLGVSAILFLQWLLAVDPLRLIA